MQVLFMASPEFAIPSLEKIHASHHQILLVVTRPDAPQKRGLKLLPTPVKVAAGSLGLPVATFPSLRDESALATLRAIRPDVIVVIAYGLLIPAPVLTLPQKLCINVHPSLLPRYRGAAPIPWAILNGEPYTGVSIIKLVKELDAGPLILQRTLDVEKNETAPQLAKRLSLLAADCLLESLSQIENGSYVLAPQNEGEVTWARKLTKKDGCIDWTEEGSLIERKIRALQPWPGTYTWLQKTMIKVLKALFHPSEPSPQLAPFPTGSIVEMGPEGPVVKVHGGTLTLTEVQPANKNVIRGADFARGLRLSKKVCFTPEPR